MGPDLWASGTTAVAINVYFEPGQNPSQLQESCDNLRAAIAQAAKHAPNFMLCAGDFHVNMHHPPSAMCTLFERTMIDLGFVRLGLQGDRRGWITRPRTASHIDGILVSADAAGMVQSCSNHKWGTDDHTHLVVTAMVTTMVHLKRARAARTTDYAEYDTGTRKRRPTRSALIVTAQEICHNMG